MRTEPALWIALGAFVLVALTVVALRWRRATMRLPAAPTVPPEQLDLRHPVVLVHGIAGFDKVRLFGIERAYFRGLAAHLQHLGVDLYFPRLQPLGTIRARAARLAELVEQLEAPRVVLIGHSMGGIDARYAVSRLGLSARVACVVTVGTPHRGTPIADVMAGGVIGFFARLFARMVSWFGLSYGAHECLTTEAMARFNKEVPNAGGVDYFSVVGAPRGMGLNLALQLTHGYLRWKSGPNDGLVPCASQRWGRVLREIDANHWAQIGWSLRFDARRFYEELLRELKLLGY